MFTRVFATVKWNSPSLYFIGEFTYFYGNTHKMSTGNVKFFENYVFSRVSSVPNIIV